MSKRAVTLAWMLCVALIAGCAKEDAEPNGGQSGASGGDGDGDGDSGDAGGDGDGDGDSGEGGDSGADGRSEVGTPEDAASGMCGMTEEIEGCTGREAYQTCLNDTCGFAECWAGPCADYLACLSDAENACRASRDGTCEEPAACTECLTADQNCVIGCFNELDCGAGGTSGEGGAGGEAGEAGTGSLPEGTCDDLDACCASLPEEEAMGCTLAAESARMEGDFTCAVYIDAFCPPDA